MVAAKMAEKAMMKEGDHKMMENRGPRMEVHLNESENGNGRLMVILEQAKHLAVSAAALATLALFSQ